MRTNLANIRGMLKRPGLIIFALLVFETVLCAQTPNTTSQVVSKDGTRIALECSGHGPTLLIVHGGTGDRKRWAHLLPLFASHFRVCAMDRRGHGESEYGANYSLQKEAEDVAGVVNAQPGSVFVLGHSIGGVFALEAAFLTKNISKLVLYEPPLQDLDHTAIADRMERLIKAENREEALLTFLSEIVKMSPDEVETMKARPVWPERVAGIDVQIREVRALSKYRFDATRVKKVKTPTLLLTGSKTASPQLKQAVESLLDTLPDRRLFVFEGEGHNAMDTIPRQFAEVVMNFLRDSSTRAQTATRTMALTIDDLPYVKIGEGVYLARARAATSKILSTLKKHKAPAIGFVNEGKLENPHEREARIALLRQWVSNGMMLGNHTYSHPDFNRLTIEEFQDEIAKGDIVTRQLMRSRQPYQLYFRHPMTHTGDTLEKKEAIERFLSTRGYKVTPHTIENSDFIFNVAYVLALQNGDRELASRVREAYLDFTIAATEFAEKISPQIFGREIPQTLLIHANDITADCLDEMLRRFAARGYKFVTLDRVMADPAYQTKNIFVTKYGPTWLFRWMKSKGMEVDFGGDPDPPQWLMDLYNKR